MSIWPTVPNPNEYMRAIIEFLLPVIAMIYIYFFLKKEKDEEVTRERQKLNLVSFVIPISIIIILVYFISGNFKYYAIAIVSNSMKPTFDRGTVVIIEQIN